MKEQLLLQEGREAGKYPQLTPELIYKHHIIPNKNIPPIFNLSNAKGKYQTNGGVIGLVDGDGNAWISSANYTADMHLYHELIKSLEEAGFTKADSMFTVEASMIALERALVESLKYPEMVAAILRSITHGTVFKCN